MKNIKLNMRKEILMGFILLFAISNISAFAISSNYWSGNPLRIYSGESMNFSIVMQNLAGTSDVKLKASITSGAEVLKLIDTSDIYTVLAGQRKNINLKVTIPQDAKPGQMYNARIDFAEMKEGKSGELGVGTAIGQSFDIIVVPTGNIFKDKPSTIIYLSIAIAMLLVVIFIVMKTRKGKLKTRKKR